LRIALTGATGFLGRTFAAAALAAGHRVRGLFRAGARTLAGVERVEGDLGDGGARRRLVEGQEVLVHLAATGVQRRDRDWQRMTLVNVVQPLALLDAAAEARVGRAVLAGTCLEYLGHGRLPGVFAAGTEVCPESSRAEPSDPYGATKAAGGLLQRTRARELGLAAWYLRFASLYGPGDDPDKLVPAALRAARARAAFEMTGGEQVREWLHVEDAVAALLAAAGRAPPGAPAIVNVGTGDAVPLRDVVTTVFRLAGADPALVRLGARPYRGEAHRLVMDVSASAAALGGWRPRSDLQGALEALVRAAPPERNADGG
jgi:nucleoside-diphosphate-sugar epimerase